MKISLIITALIYNLSFIKKEDVCIVFENDYEDVYHLSLIIYTSDGKNQTRVSDIKPFETKSYSWPVGTEIYVADWKQEAFAMKGNDIKSTGLKPYLVLKDSDAKRIIRLSSIGLNRK